MNIKIILVLIEFIFALHEMSKAKKEDILWIVIKASIEVIGILYC